jgi:hypothetical protein
MPIELSPLIKGAIISLSVNSMKNKIIHMRVQIAMATSMTMGTTFRQKYYNQRKWESFSYHTRLNALMHNCDLFRTLPCQKHFTSPPHSLVYEMKLRFTSIQSILLDRKNTLNSASAT